MERTPDYIKGATISPEKTAWMRDHAPRPPGEALDLGCGAGLYSRWLAREGWKVIAVDRTPPAAMDGLETRAHDLEQGLPFPDARFDLVLAWDVLEHVEAEEPLWMELVRVLRPGGVLLGSVPHSGDARLHAYNLTFKHHVDKTHCREYGRDDIQERMRRVGLSPLQLDLRGPVSPQVLAEFVTIKPLRGLVAKMVGAVRRVGLLDFGELHADVFFAGKKAD